MEKRKLVRELLQGGRPAAAQLISLVESDRAGARAVMKELAPFTGTARIIGITGPPGSGKSTMINALTGILRKKEMKVGIIAIDPTSPLSGGAVLGDRIRMREHFGDPGVFIRSMASRAGRGGLSRAAGDAAAVLDAFGMDIIFVETTGVGQSETAIRGLAHLVVVVVTPNMGDDVQMMKAGLLEIGDVIALNKGDLPDAGRKAEELENVLRLLPQGRKPPPVIITATQNGTGLSQLLEELEKATASLSPAIARKSK